MSANTINVTGLPADVTADAVTEFFTKAGPVAKVTVNEGGSAVVEMERDDDVSAALDFNDAEFVENVRIQVTRPTTATKAVEGDEGHQSRSRSRSPGGSPSKEHHSVVVLKLPAIMREPELRTFFAPCGEITNVFVDRHRFQFAFVYFATAEAVQEAVKLNGTEFQGVKVEVEERRGKKKQFRVVITDFNNETTEAQVKELLESAGTLTDFYFNLERRICFATLSSQEEFEKALTLNGTELNGAKISVKERESRVCFKCGKEGHIGAQCKNARRDVECHNCGRRGHFARDCRSAPMRHGGPRDRRDRGPRHGGRRDGPIDRRRRRSDSYDRDRRRYSRSRSPPRRRYSRSRSPPRRYRRSRSYTPSRSRSPPRRR